MEVIYNLGIRNPLWNAGFFNGKTITFFGDSIVNRVIASSPSKGYTSVLCSKLNATEQNFGISGSTLEKRDPVDPISQNMVDRTGFIPVKTSNHAILCFGYGMNDFGFSYPSYTPDNFKEDYNTVLSAAISVGWNVENILIISPSWVSDLAFPYYHSVKGNNPTRERIESFVQASREVAEDLGTGFFDMYRYLGNTILPDQLIYSDGVHPVDTGHNFFACGLYEFFTWQFDGMTVGKPTIKTCKRTTAISSFGRYFSSVSQFGKSYLPTRQINSIASINEGETYVFISKKSISLHDILE